VCIGAVAVALLGASFPLQPDAASADRTAEPTAGPRPIASGVDGATVFRDRQCGLCHGYVDTGDGPTLRGLWGSRVTLDDGTAVTADAAYIRESIVDPDAKVVEGYEPGTMGESVDGLTDAEVDALVRLIKSFGDPDG
jgi:cytochrome c oxidase subunit 2